MSCRFTGVKEVQQNLPLLRLFHPHPAIERSYQKGPFLRRLDTCLSQRHKETLQVVLPAGLVTIESYFAVSTNRLTQPPPFSKPQDQPSCLPDSILMVDFPRRWCAILGLGNNTTLRR